LFLRLSLARGECKEMGAHPLKERRRGLLELIKKKTGVRETITDDWKKVCQIMKKAPKTRHKRASRARRRSSLKIN